MLTAGCREPDGSGASVARMYVDGTGLSRTEHDHVMPDVRWRNPPVENQVRFHAWRIGLDEHPGGARIECSPAALPFAVVIAARASLADTAAELRSLAEPARHHDRLVVVDHVAFLNVDRLDHHAPIDPDRPRP